MNSSFFFLRMSFCVVTCSHVATLTPDLIDFLLCLWFDSFKPFLHSLQRTHLTAVQQWVGRWERCGRGRDWGDEEGESKGGTSRPKSEGARTL